MATGSMGVMLAKFGSGFAAYSYSIFVLLYVPCVSVICVIAREAGKNWMIFSFFWGSEHRRHHNHAVLSDRYFCGTSWVQFDLHDQRAGAERHYPAGIAESRKPCTGNTGDTSGGKGGMSRLPWWL